MISVEKKEIRQIKIPTIQHAANALQIFFFVSSFFCAPRQCAMTTVTPLPIPIRNPVYSDTRLVVEPTAPSAV